MLSPDRYALPECVPAGPLPGEWIDQPTSSQPRTTHHQVLGHEYEVDLWFPGLELLRLFLFPVHDHFFVRLCFVRQVADRAPKLVVRRAGDLPGASLPGLPTSPYGPGQFNQKGFVQDLSPDAALYGKQQSFKGSFR